MKRVGLNHDSSPIHRRLLGSTLGGALIGYGVPFSNHLPAPPLAYAIAFAAVLALLDRGRALYTNVVEKLSEKGYEQRSDRGFGRYTEHEMGQKGTFRLPMGLRCERL
jgi:hypothetical protein